MLTYSGEGGCPRHSHKSHGVHSARSFHQPQDNHPTIDRPMSSLSIQPLPSESPCNKQSIALLGHSSKGGCPRLLQVPNLSITDTDMTKSPDNHLTLERPRSTFLCLLSKGNEHDDRQQHEDKQTAYQVDKQHADTILSCPVYPHVVARNNKNNTIQDDRYQHDGQYATSSFVQQHTDI